MSSQPTAGFVWFDPANKCTAASVFGFSVGFYGELTDATACCPAGLPRSCACAWTAPPAPGPLWTPLCGRWRSRAGRTMRMLVRALACVCLLQAAAVADTRHAMLPSFWSAASATQPHTLRHSALHPFSNLCRSRALHRGGRAVRRAAAARGGSGARGGAPLAPGGRRRGPLDTCHQVGGCCSAGGWLRLALLHTHLVSRTATCWYQRSTANPSLRAHCPPTFTAVLCHVAPLAGTAWALPHFLAPSRTQRPRA